MTEIKSAIERKAANRMWLVASQSHGAPDKWKTRYNLRLASVTAVAAVVPILIGHSRLADAGSTELSCGMVNRGLIRNGGKARPAMQEGPDFPA